MTMMLGTSFSSAQLRHLRPSPSSPPRYTLRESHQVSPPPSKSTSHSDGPSFLFSPCRSMSPPSFHFRSIMRYFSFCYGNQGSSFPKTSGFFPYFFHEQEWALLTPKSSPSFSCSRSNLSAFLLFSIVDLHLRKRIFLESIFFFRRTRSPLKLSAFFVNRLSPSWPAGTCWDCGRSLFPSCRDYGVPSFFFFLPSIPFLLIDAEEPVFVKTALSRCGDGVLIPQQSADRVLLKGYKVPPLPLRFFLFVGGNASPPASILFFRNCFPQA